MSFNDIYTATGQQWQEQVAAGDFDREFARIYGLDQVAVWRANYLEALACFAARFGGEGEWVVARCPGQMNAMGMHIDYGGMPSLRLAVRGADTLVVARKMQSRRVRVSSLLRSPGEAEDRFAPIEIDLDRILPAERVCERQALMDYAGRVCQQRLERTGSALADDWSVLVEGQLAYVESYFRDRIPLGGFDGLVWSSVSPSGGMSSSSALVVATALAAMGTHGLVPRRDMPEQDLVDGLGMSEWIRGTRGGTADHGGMVLGRAGKLVSVGVFPARAEGEAALPDDYAAVVLDSGIERQYDEAVKEETVIAYPLSAFIAGELILPCWEYADGDRADRIRYIRDLTSENLQLPPAAIFELLAQMPQWTTLARVRAQAEKAGVGDRYAAMYQRDIAGKYQYLTADTPLYIRRRCAYALAEQDRVAGMIDYLNAGDMTTALELIRISHRGDFDVEVGDGELRELAAGAGRGDERARLRFLPGGYGRMTPAYDRLVQVVNAFLGERGAVQRLGAGWGGNIGGLIHRDFIDGPKAGELAEFLRGALGGAFDMVVATPGEGAALLARPGAA